MERHWYGKLVVAFVVLIAAMWSSCKGDNVNEYEKTIDKLIKDNNIVPLYKDPSSHVELRVQDLLSRMSLSEKVGQMTQIERSVATLQVIKDFGIGSILNGGGSVPAPNAKASIWADMIDGFQEAALSTRLEIPMMFGTDAVHGHNNLYGATIFPHNIGLGATRDPDLLRRIGAATALEVRASGVPYAFAPCVAVCRDPRWGRCYESYSEETEVVRNMSEIILGLQGSPPVGHPIGYPYVAGGSNVVGCAKHYVGDGGTTKGVNENDTVANYFGLYRVHMLPYLDAVAKGVSTIMASYSSWNGVKMHANHHLLTEVLKGQMGFKGFVISDWAAIDRITSPPGSNYSYSILACINAGIDMVMVPYNFETYVNELTSLVKSSKISMSRIDDAVSRILRVKFIAGLFEQPFTNRTLFDIVGNTAHRELAREAVRKSLVLLKNGKTPGEPLLPLNRNASKILITGSHAHNLGYQCGGWTVSWDGGSGRTTKGTTIFEAVKKTVSNDTEVVYKQNPDVEFINKTGFAYTIAVIGEPPYVETKGDNHNLTIPLGGADIINKVCNNKTSVPCLVILISGRPLVLEPYIHKIDAFVAAWLPGTEGLGVADVIFGDYDFQGRLPRTWFKRVDQLPMNVGDRHYDPLFPFGYGLTMNNTRPHRPHTP